MDDCIIIKTSNEYLLRAIRAILDTNIHIEETEELAYTGEWIAENLDRCIVYVDKDNDDA